MNLKNFTVTDWIIVLLGALAAGVYGGYLWTIRNEYTVSWGGYVFFVIIASIITALGYYTVRESESKEGSWSPGEFLGTLCVAIGLMIISEGMFGGFITQIFENVPKPVSSLPNPQPPIVTKTGDQLTIERIGEKDGRNFIKDDQIVKVKVVLILDAEKDGNTYKVDPVKIPAELHGKVWYEVEGQKSLADEF